MSIIFYNKEAVCNFENIIKLKNTPFPYLKMHFLKVGHRNLNILEKLHLLLNMF